MSDRGSLVPLTDSQREHFSWLRDPHVEKIIKAFNTADSGALRFVGGCVRDSLLGQRPKDIDAATTLRPELVIDLLAKAGLRSVPTGVEHGTVTAIADHKAIEITTLRSDISTDGRRATVAFTDDWAEDAKRRDFTVNAIYLTPDEQLFDPTGGVNDLSHRRVVFIGNAEERIKEDYLRIMRFFRFSARFCEGFDPAGLAACMALKDGISSLSAERVGEEFSQILRLPKARFALEGMKETAILPMIWQSPADLDALERIKKVDAAASVPLLLAALYGDAGSGIDQRLRTSNAEKAIRENAMDAFKKLRAPFDQKTIRAQLYQLGKDSFADGLTLAYANKRLPAQEFRRVMELVSTIEVPEFAISGKHIVAAGVPPGPAISALLASIEARWIDEDFPGEERQHELLRAAIPVAN
ncbi:CCA tRNA nucleotidyltransferase [Hyphococcus formosus]|uniref:CCA tRNA nucleotidyltransferase n=1 Tax=Hyphococcus formosus TaxID=3143534 RepID=UPI00398A811C